MPFFCVLRLFLCDFCILDAAKSLSVFGKFFPVVLYD